MSRIVYISNQKQQNGCGCLALILLLALIFLKSFWKPLLFLFLALTVIGWLRATFAKARRSQAQENPFGDIHNGSYSSQGRPKNQNVIEGEFEEKSE